MVQTYQNLCSVSKIITLHKLEYVRHLDPYLVI